MYMTANPFSSLSVQSIAGSGTEKVNKQATFQKIFDEATKISALFTKKFIHNRL